MMKQPSAVMPIVMSLVALGVVLGHVSLYGVVHEADEGTPAHVFQVLIAGQVPIVVFFAAKWLPRAPREAALVLAAHAVAGVAALAPVYILGL